jgi:hypothetical protein
MTTAPRVKPATATSADQRVATTRTACLTRDACEEFADRCAALTANAALTSSARTASVRPDVALTIPAPTISRASTNSAQIHARSQDNVDLAPSATSSTTESSAAVLKE